MVQCTESWFLADRQALASYYGQGFVENALPRNPDVEAIAKGDVLAGLQAATRLTRTKGPYHKTRHGFALLGIIDPGRVRGASRHADRLFSLIAQG